VPFVLHYARPPREPRDAGPYRYSDELRRLIDGAATDATRCGHERVTPDHLLAGALLDERFAALVVAARIDPARLRREVDERLAELPTSSRGRVARLAPDLLRAITVGSSWMTTFRAVSLNDVVRALQLEAGPTSPFRGISLTATPAKPPVDAAAGGYRSAAATRVDLHIIHPVHTSLDQAIEILGATLGRSPREVIHLLLRARDERRAVVATLTPIEAEVARERAMEMAREVGGSMRFTIAAAEPRHVRLGGLVGDPGADP
jgi:hypothetical protein